MQELLEVLPKGGRGSNCNGNNVERVKKIQAKKGVNVTCCMALCWRG